MTEPLYYANAHRSAFYKILDNKTVLSVIAHFNTHIFSILLSAKYVDAPGYFLNRTRTGLVIDDHVEPDEGYVIPITAADFNAAYEGVMDMILLGRAAGETAKPAPLGIRIGSDET